MTVMTQITKSTFPTSRGLGRKQGAYVPVQMLRFRDGLLALMASEDRDEWFIMSQDARENFFWVSQVFRSRGMSSRVFEELCEELTASEREAITSELIDSLTLKERAALASELADELALKERGLLTSKLADELTLSQREAISEVTRLGLADDDFPEKTKYRELARKVSSEDTW